MDRCERNVDDLDSITFFTSFIWPIMEFFLPISVTSMFLWLLLRPNQVLPRVDALLITNFSLTPNNSALLDYDVAVDLSFHNSHRFVDARYLDLTAVASYGGTRLGPTVDVLPVFTQRPEATNVVHAVFQGAAAPLAPAAAKVFAEEASNGTFHLLVTVSSTFMYNVLLKKEVYYYRHDCYITFPFPAPRHPHATALRD